MNYRRFLIPQLKIDEAVKPKPYLDTKGKLTVGVGRNLTDVGLRPDEIDYLLNNDVNVAEAAVRNHVTIFNQLSDLRQSVLVNMAFNMGDHVFAEFVQTLKAVNAGQFEDASRLMLESRWATQVGARAQRLARQMKEDML